MYSCVVTEQPPVKRLVLQPSLLFRVFFFLALSSASLRQTNEPRLSLPVPENDFSQVTIMFLAVSLPVMLRCAGGCKSPAHLSLPPSHVHQ
jgi:hypothetical protein